MAASSAYSSLYDSTTLLPIAGRPRTTSMGIQSDWVSITVATTSIDEAGDNVYLMPVPSGKRLIDLIFDAADFDSNGSPTLDMDIVLRTTSAAGAHTDTILYNAGTAFTAAQTSKWVFCDVAVPSGAYDYSHLILYVNTAAATAASGAFKIRASWA